jgi:calcineurin-like phosphoesterase family protein
MIELDKQNFLELKGWVNIEGNNWVHKNCVDNPKVNLKLATLSKDVALAKLGYYGKPEHKPTKKNTGRKKREHKTFIISDLHLSHTNMATYRGFKSSEEHDETIISNWNSVVNNGDTVYVLGDITMEKATCYHLLSRLNGNIHVILGNHDMRGHVEQLLKHVKSVASCFKYKNILFSHIPIHPFELDRYRFNIHGHVHAKTLGDKRYINVSCEAVDFKPVELNGLIKSRQMTKITRFINKLLVNLHIR